MRKIMLSAMLIGMICGSAWARTVDFDEAARVAIKATQVATWAPTGLRVQTCDGEAILQQKFADEPQNIPLAREMARMRKYIQDATTMQVVAIETDLRRARVVPGPVQAAYMTLARPHLAPIASVLVQAVLRAGDEPGEDLLYLEGLYPNPFVDVTCTRLPCCDKLCWDCCSRSRCDGSGVGCENRWCHCKSSPTIIGQDCTDPPLNCDINEPLPSPTKGGGAAN